MNKDIPIIKIGNPILAQVSDPIDKNQFGGENLITLVNNMQDAMKQHGGVGIAAPQIGVNKRVIVFGFEKMERKKVDPIPNTVLINPTIKILSEETEEDFEGCLSIGKLMAKVPRYKKIFYTAYDMEGVKIEREVSGMHARIVQHEVDHLDGITFLERVEDKKSFGLYDEFKKIGAFGELPS